MLNQFLKKMLGRNSEEHRRTSVVDQIIMSRQSHKEHLSSLISSSTSSRYSSSPNQSNNFLSNALLTSGDQTPPTNPESPLTMNLPINNEEYNAMMNEGAYSTSPTLTSNTLQFIIPSIYGKQEENEEENIFVSIIKKSSQQNAIESICRLLETPQDLEKLADLKANTQKQVEKLETQVSTLSSTQIEEADQAIQLIKQIRGDVREQLDERVENSIFGLMRDLGENNMQLIEHYDVVSEILLAHNNVRKTIEKLETLTILQDQIRRIKKKLSYENDKYVLSAHEGRCVKFVRKKRERFIISQQIHNFFAHPIHVYMLVVVQIHLYVILVVQNHLQYYVGGTKSSSMLVVIIISIINIHHTMMKIIFRYYCIGGN